MKIGKVVPAVCTPLFLLLAASILFLSCASQTGTISPKLIEKGVEFDSDLVAEFNAKGWQALWMNDFVGAREAFEMAINENPNDASSLRGFGLSLSAHGYYLEAFDAFLRSIEADPLSPLAVPVRDYMTTELIDSKSAIDRLATSEKAFLKRTDLPLWNQREYLLNLEGYHHKTVMEYEKVKEIGDSLQTLRGWSIVGPFSNIAMSGFGKDFINEHEFAATPDLSQTYTGLNNMEVEWFTPQIHGLVGEVNFYRLFDISSLMAGYAYRELDVPETQPWLFVVHCYGSLKFWIDGDEVLDKHTVRSGADIYWVRKDLTAGKHNLLTKNCSAANGLAVFTIYAQPISETLDYELTSEVTSVVYDTLFSGEERTEFELDDPLMERLAQLVDDNPDKLEYYYWLAFMMGIKSYEEEAIHVIDRADILLKEAPGVTEESAILCEKRYDLLVDMGKKDEARAAIQKAFRVAEDFAPAVAYFAKDMMERKNYRRVEAINNVMLAINNEWLAGLLQKSVLLAQRDNMEDAYVIFDQMERLYPDVADLYDLLIIRAENFSLESEVPALQQKKAEAGNPLDATEYFLERAFQQRDYARASQIAADLLHYYPDLASQYEIYYRARLLDGASMDSILACMDETLCSFPFATDLWNLKAAVLEQQLYNIRSFMDQNPQLLKADPNGAAELEAMLTTKRDELHATLSQLLEISPTSIYARNKLRQLEEKTPYDELYERKESSDVIEEYEAQDHEWDTEAVQVLKDMVGIYFHDGAQRKYYHEIFQVLTEKGKENYSTVSLSYHPYFSDVELLRSHLIKPDGSQVEGVQFGAKISFPSLEVGDYIEVQYTVDEYQPGRLSSEFWTEFMVEEFIPVFSERFQLIYPKDKKIFCNELHADRVILEKKTKSVDGLFETIIYTTGNLEPLADEPFSGAYRDQFCTIDVSTMDDWGIIDDWYRDLYTGQCNATVKIREKLDELLDGTESDEMIVAKVYDFVAKEIQYEDLDFQYSRFVPQTAESVLEDGFGDCKDKCVLMITMLREKGIPAYIALNRPGYAGNHFFQPSPRFTHVITVVPLGEDTLIVDPTAEEYTFGELPGSLPGSNILPIDFTAGKERETIQKVSSCSDPKGTKMELSIQVKDKAFQLEGMIEAHGHYAALFRELFRAKSPMQQATDFTDYWNDKIPGFVLDTLSTENMDDLLNAPVVHFSGHVNDMLIRHDNKISGVRLPWLTNLSTSLASSFSLSSRENEMSIKYYFLQSPVEQSIRFTVPDGYTISSLPRTERLHLESIVADFSFEKESSKSFVGRRYYLFPNMDVPAENYPVFRDFILNWEAKEEEQVLIR